MKTITVSLFLIIASHSLVYGLLDRETRDILLQERDRWYSKSQKRIGLCVLPLELSPGPDPAANISQTCSGFNIHVNNDPVNPVVARWPDHEWTGLIDLIYGRETIRKFIEMDALFSKVGTHGCFVNGTMRVVNETFIDIAYDRLLGYYVSPEYHYTLTGVSVPNTVEKATGKPIRCFRIQGEDQIKWGMGEVCRRASLVRYTWPPNPTVISSCRKSDGRMIVQIRADVNHDIYFHLGNPIPLVPSGYYEQKGIFTGYWEEEEPFNGNMLARVAQLDNYNFYKKANCTVIDTCN